MSAAVQEVQKQALRNKFRLDDYFRDFDPLNHKQISVNRFERALSIAKVILSRNHIDSLIQEFDAGSGNVDYATFCDQVNEVYAVKGLESSPTKQVKLALAGTNRHIIGHLLKPKDEPLLNEVLRKLRKDILDRGIIIKLFFRDFDKSNTGFVSESRFKRALQSALPQNVTMEDANILSRAYSDGENIYYRKFSDDVSNPPGTAESLLADATQARAKAESLLQPSTSTSILSKSWRQNDADLILSRLIRIVSERKIRLKMFFDDCDKMRKGVIKRPKFKTCMFMCIPNEFTEAELDTLADSYAIPNSSDDFIDYRSMCSYIDLAFTSKNLERSPLKTCDSKPWRIAHAAPGQLAELNIAEEEEFDAGIRELRHIVQQSRMSLMDVFRDFDRTCRGAVTRDQFERVLSIRNIRPGQRMVELLVKKFGFTTGGGDGTVLVRYRPFMTAVGSVGSAALPVEETKVEKPSGVPPPSNIDVGKTWREGSNADQVLWKIRQFIRGRRVRTKEFFRDSDPLQKGVISIYKFRQGLKEMLAQADLSNAQLQTLEPLYLHSGSLDEATWTSFLPMIDWRRFVEDLESVFTVSGLERQPTLDVLAQTNKVIEEGWTSEVSLTPQERDRLNDYMRDMSENVVRCNILTRMSFRKLDKHKRGVLPSERFVRCLSLVFNSTRFTDIMPLIAKSEFAVRSLGQRKDVYDVNYKMFCDIIDPPPSSGVKTEYSVTATERPKASLENIDMDSIMNRIREYVKSRGIPLDIFFKDYDQLRTGSLSMGKMHRALDVALGTNFRLTYQEKQAICEKYKSTEKPDEVYWYKFFLDIEQRVHLEASPTKGVPGWKKWRFDVEATGVNMNELNPIIQNTRRIVNERRMAVKSAFQNYDKTNRGTVTKNQFTCVLGFLGLLPPSRSEVECLLKAFGMIKPGKTDQAYYPAFCQLVDPGVN
jgi:Ca2+-binding EF-hand superfamily protein